MQSLYLLGTRQIASLNQDLAQLEPRSEPSVLDGPVDRAALLGQCVASLQAFQRTIDDYEGMAKRELVRDKQVKAEGRIERFRDDYSNIRKHLDRLKAAHQAEAASSDRNNLLQSAASSSSTSQWSQSGLSARRPLHAAPIAPAESPFTIPSRSATPQAAASGKAYGSRADAALDENSFLHSTGTALDQYIAQGQAVLNNLGTQRDVMKDAQRRLLSTANTLGMSRSTINFIERRSRGDMYVLLFGGLGTLVAFYYILRWFG